jgi:hypothetical protein
MEENILVTPQTEPHGSFMTPPQPVPQKKKRRWGWILVVLLIGLFTYIGLTAYNAIKGAAYAMDARRSALLAVERAKVFDIDGALTEAANAQNSFRASHRYLLTLTPYQVIPEYGRALRAATKITDDAADILKQVIYVGEEMRAALGDNAQELFSADSGLLPDISSSLKELTSEEKERLLEALANNAPRIDKIADSLDDITAELPELLVPDITWLTTISFAEYRDQIPALTEKLQPVASQMRAVAPLMALVPRLLGFPEERKYMLLFANNTELRPTGGFLGVIGMAYVRSGELSNLDIRDVYAYDGALLKTVRPPSPQPFAEYINVKEWFLRDANWSPDFPESVKTIEQFYIDAQRAANADATTPDAYIQFDPEPIAELMTITGPITVQGKTFNAENLVEELEFQVEFGFVDAGIEYDDRKQIIIELGDAFIERMKDLSFSQLLAAFAIIERGFQEGHIAVYSHDTTLQTIIDARHWGGRLLPVNGDYIAVVDANLGALKSDPKVLRNIVYTIAPDATHGYIGKVAITYNHIGTFDKFTSRYRTYTRLYVPAGSKFLSSKGTLLNDRHFNPRLLPGHVDVVEELGRLSFGAFTSIEPKRTGTLEFTFALAPSVIDAIRRGDYQLDVEKQKGTHNHGLTLNLDFGSLLKTAEPAEDPKNFGDTRYTLITDLLLNRHFSVGLRK